MTEMMLTGSEPDKHKKEVKLWWQSDSLDEASCKNNPDNDVYGNFFEDNDEDKDGDEDDDDDDEDGSEIAQKDRSSVWVNGRYTVELLVMRIERMDLLNDGFQRPMKVTHGNVKFCVCIVVAIQIY